jgi:glutathione S-transferase
MDYLTPAAARDLPGVRLALTMNSFAPWGQAVKKMLEYKGVGYAPVGQHMGEANEDLVRWTGSRNAPVIIWDNEPPASRWLDQIMLIENQKATPPLLPRDSFSRALTVGIVGEIAGEFGFGWARRLMIFERSAAQASAAPSGLPPQMRTMANAYSHRPEGIEPRARVADIVGMLAAQLKAQRAKGSPFLVGEAPSAADIYWACFSPLLAPLPDAYCTVPEAMEKARSLGHPAMLGTDDPLVAAASDPILLQHRDMMFEKYLGPCWV